jgi:hypothetical protein
MILLMDFK